MKRFSVLTCRCVVTCEQCMNCISEHNNSVQFEKNVLRFGIFYFSKERSAKATSTFRAKIEVLFCWISSLRYFSLRSFNDSACRTLCQFYDHNTARLLLNANLLWGL